MKYKIIESSVDYLKNVEFEFEFDQYTIGDSAVLFGQTATVTQKGSGIISLSSSNVVLVLQEIINI